MVSSEMMKDLNQPHGSKRVKEIVVRKPQQPLQSSVGKLKHKVMSKVVMNLREESRVWKIAR